jgi:isocitrate/isopropylmalate dehydrogenase
MKIIMIAGDGIGPEITAATREVLDAANSSFNEWRRL